LTLVRPILEYAVDLWLPFHKNQLIALESVQRRFTKRIHGFYNLSYTQRLQQLQTPSLWWRFARGSLITTFKVLVENYGGDAAKSMFTLSNINFTRGHPLKLARPQVRYTRTLNFFTYRVIDTWNSLPHFVVGASSANEFKNKLDHYVINHTAWYYHFIE